MNIHVWAMAVVWSVGVVVAQPPPMAVVSPEVHADRTITFRMMAPNAKQVTLSGELTRTAIAMYLRIGS
jgi:hypothetical protein